MSNSIAIESQRLQQEEAVVIRPSKKSRDYQQMGIYKDVNPLDWEDWHWQLKYRIRNKEELSQIIKENKINRGLYSFNCKGLFFINKKTLKSNGKETTFL